MENVHLGLLKADLEFVWGVGYTVILSSEFNHIRTYCFMWTSGKHRGFCIVTIRDSVLLESYFCRRMETTSRNGILMFLWIRVSEFHSCLIPFGKAGQTMGAIVKYTFVLVPRFLLVCRENLYISEKDTLSLAQYNFKIFYMTNPMVGSLLTPSWDPVTTWISIFSLWLTQSWGADLPKAWVPLQHEFSIFYMTMVGSLLTPSWDPVTSWISIFSW